MNRAAAFDVVTLGTLRAAVGIPFIYYGMQAVGAAFFPGYSFVRDVASLLGSDRAGHAVIFNAGIMTLGVLTLAASGAFVRAMLCAGTRPVLAALTGAVLAVGGVQSLWAGWFPMPDPRHGGHPVFMVAMLLLPLLIGASLWRRAGRGLRVYLVANLVLLAAMVPIMSGLIATDRAAYAGLFQRVFTLAIFPPIGVAGWVLAGWWRGGRASERV